MHQKVGAVAAFKQVVVVPKLPKTRSGKVARSTLVAMAAGKPFKVSRGFVALFSDTWLCRSLMPVAIKVESKACFFVVAGLFSIFLF